MTIWLDMPFQMQFRVIDETTVRFARTGDRDDHALLLSQLDILDAGHFTWEDATDENARLVTTWWDGGYAATRKRSMS